MSAFLIVPAIFVGAIILLGLIYRMLSGRTVTVAGPFGYSKSTYGPRKPDIPLTNEQLLKLIRRLMKGDLFVGLSISPTSEPSDEIAWVFEEPDLINLNTSWPIRKGLEGMERFIAFMRGLGLEPTSIEDENTMIRSLTSKSLTYLMARDLGEVQRITDALLSDFYNLSPSDRVVAKPWNFDEIKPGVSIGKERDLLAEALAEE
jgi:hypothetical protein